MGAVSNVDVNASKPRVLSKATVKCSVKEARDTEGKPREDGSQMDTLFVTLQFEEDVKTEDGEVIPAGGTIDIGLNTVKNPQDDKGKKMNEISGTRMHELFRSALKLGKEVKDVMGELTGAGGLEGLKGKPVVVDFAPGNDRTNVKRFSAVSEDA